MKHGGKMKKKQFLKLNKFPEPSNLIQVEFWDIREKTNSAEVAELQRYLSNIQENIAKILAREETLETVT